MTADSRSSEVPGAAGASRRGPRNALRQDAAAAFALTMLAISGFRTVFAGWEFAAVGTAATLLGLGIAWLAIRLVMRALGIASLALAVFTLAAGPVALRGTTLALVVPTGDTLRDALRGSVAGWRDLLTMLPPVRGEDHLLMIPYLCGFVSGLLTPLLAYRLRRWARSDTTGRRGGWAVVVPVLPPVGVLVTTLFLGTQQPAAVLLQSSAFLVVLVAWAAANQRLLRQSTMAALAHSASTPLRGAAVMLAVAGLVAGGLSVVVPQPERFVLRDHVVPPFDPSQYPSPLAGYRWFEVLHKDDVLFSIAGVPQGSRVNIAVMDAYDGVVWGVAGGRGATQASGAFQRTGTVLPDAAGQPVASTEVRVTIGVLGGVWLPTVGSLGQISFAGAGAEALASSFRFNRATGVGVVGSGLQSGDSYTLSVRATTPPRPDGLGSIPFGALTLPDPAGVPDQVQAAAIEWTGTASTPTARVQSLVNKLRSGAFSDGTAESGARSRPGHGAARIRDFLSAEQLVGDGEQYAATLALLARSIGIPARVVLGVVPPADWTGGEVTGEMVSAWVEVNYAGTGWVPFDATPPVTNKPAPVTRAPQQKGESEIVSPPLAGELPPAQLPPPVGEIECVSECGLPWPIPWWATVLLTPLVLFGMLWFIKNRRSSRRRRRGSASDQVRGAWLELADRLLDLGVAVPATRTRAETAEAIAVHRAPWLPQSVRHGIVPLASTANRMIFGPDPLGPDDARAHWRLVQGLAKEARAARSRWRRLLAVVNPASLGFVVPESVRRELVRRTGQVGDLGRDYATRLRPGREASASSKI